MTEKTYGFSILGGKTKVFVIIIILLGLFTIVAEYKNPEIAGKSSAVTIVGLLLGYLMGCFCQIIAREKGRDPNIAFAIGFCFSIVGATLYWIYTWCFKEVKEDGES